MTIAMRIMISSEEIQTKVKQLGEKSMHTMLKVTKGTGIDWFTAWFSHFMADLCRAIENRMNSILWPFQIWQRDGFNPWCQNFKRLDGEIHGKDVLVVEDIIDSGIPWAKSLKCLKPVIQTQLNFVRW